MIPTTAETIGHLGFFNITNSYLTSIVISLILVITAFIFSRNLKLIPGKFQNIIEYIIEFMFNTARETVGDEKRSIEFFPLVATFFLYILIANWFGLLPFVGNINIHNIPLFRPVNTDLNSTVSLAIISAIATQYFAIKHMGLKKHLLRYFSFNPINQFVGILEIVSEFTKIISLSFRLYGNIFAGDMVISTFTSFIGFLLPLPFIGLEVVVGFVQAAVFAMLTLAFTSILTQELH